MDAALRWWISNTKPRQRWKAPRRCDATSRYVSPASAVRRGGRSWSSRRGIYSRRSSEHTHHRDTETQRKTQEKDSSVPLWWILGCMKREYPDRPLIGVGAVIIERGRALIVRRATEPL